MEALVLSLGKLFPLLVKDDVSPVFLFPNLEDGVPTIDVFQVFGRVGLDSHSVGHGLDPFCRGSSGQNSWNLQDVVAPGGVFLKFLLNIFLKRQFGVAPQTDEGWNFAELCKLDLRRCDFLLENTFFAPLPPHRFLAGWLLLFPVESASRKFF